MRASGQAGRGVVIEEVTDLDVAWPVLQELFLALHEFHAPWTARSLRDDWESRWRDYIRPGPDRLILLAWDGDRAIAYLNAFVRRDFGLFDEVPGIIDDTFVRQEYRRSGVGSALVERCQEWFKARGATELRLNVSAGNELGQSFWRRMGFSPMSYLVCKEPEASP